MADSQKVVTRFAPSPTGSLHVGGARTALFAWAYARKHGGKFILRIEDTDQTRSSEAATQGILRDMQWLGLNWDDGPYFQSQRLPLYNEQVEHLLKAGQAYEDAGAVRLRMGAHRGDIAFADAVYGPITVQKESLEDFVIRKSDGFPTFHLAVVVDDALMGVTHVIRGQEHLSNTPKHAALFDALSFPRPTFAHLPTIMNPDGSKMSKRDKAKKARTAALESKDSHGLLSVGFGEAEIKAFLDKQSDDVRIAEAVAKHLHVSLPEINLSDFQRSGYLPDVLLNYLALLGWNPGNDVERFDLDFLKQHFGLDRINKGNSKFDREKLFRFNADTLAALSPGDFAAKLREHFQRYHVDALQQLGERFTAFAAAYQGRARTLEEAFEAGQFLLAADDELKYDEKAVEKILAKSDGYAVLRELAARFAKIEPWSGKAAHDAMAAYAQEKSLGMGKVAQPVRVAVSGGTVSPPIDATLEVLGKEATLRRIARCLEAGAG